MSRPLKLASPGAVIATTAFTAIAIMRAVQGDTLWAVTFALAAAGYAWLAATRTRRAVPATRGRSTARAASSTDVARRCRTWRNLTASTAALTSALAIWSEPAIALLGVATTAAAATGWLSARRTPTSRTARHQGVRP